MVNMPSTLVDLPLLLGLAAGIVLGALVTWLASRPRQVALRVELDATLRELDSALRRADEIWADRQTMAQEFRALTGRALAEQDARAHETSELGLRATERLLAPVRSSLDKLNDRLGEVERQRVGISADLSAQVQAVRATGEELRRETAALGTALRRPHVRGAWGEMQLRRVVEVAGMVEHCDFDTQATTTVEDKLVRPDMIIRLSAHRVVFVDSKVPLAAFLDAQEARDEASRTQFLAQFARNVRTHIDQLSAKNYFRADPGSPEFVVLFLPSEALASEALTQAADLYEYAAARNIVLATPSTLIALLRSVAYGWRQAELSRSASEVFALGRELYDRLGTLGAHMDKLGRSLNATVKAYNVALGSLETRVLVSGRRMRDLHVVDAELAQPAPCDEVARPVTAPELVDGSEASMSPFLLDEPEPHDPTPHRETSHGDASHAGTDSAAADDASARWRP